MTTMWRSWIGIVLATTIVCCLFLLFLDGASCLSQRVTTTTTTVSRRQALSDVLARSVVVATAATGTSVLVVPCSINNQLLPAVWAATAAPPTPDELKRIQVGYQQITEFLNNFEAATTTCRENGGECKRDAEPIRRVLGLRSTTDPLFQIEKVFDKVKYMDTTADGAEIDLDTFFQATEDWNSAMTISNSMAFISQFGEYNPGGGKDEVLKYLNESKKAVIQAQASLKKIMDALGLPELTTTTAA